MIAETGLPVLGIAALGGALLFVVLVWLVSIGSDTLEAAPELTPETGLEDELAKIRVSGARDEQIDLELEPNLRDELGKARAYGRLLEAESAELSRRLSLHHSGVPAGHACEVCR